MNSNLLRKQTRGLSQNSSWSDESPRNSSQLNSSSSADDVILIDDDDDDDDRDDDYNDDDDDDDDGDHRFSGNSNGLYSNGLGLNHVANGTGEAKAYTCDICHSKLSSSYNLKRHMMIHTGKARVIWYFVFVSRSMPFGRLLSVRVLSVCIPYVGDGNGNILLCFFVFFSLVIFVCLRFLFTNRRKAIRVSDMSATLPRTKRPEKTQEDP